MKPLITGFAFAIIVVAACFVVPMFMPASISSNTLDALEQAELARRQLHTYDASLPLLKPADDVDQPDTKLVRLINDNAALLSAAKKNSQSAIRMDRDALDVGTVAGTVSMTEAAGLLAEARHWRSRLIALQADLFAAATDWAALQAQAAHYVGLDVTNIKTDLDTDLEEVQAVTAQVRQEVDELTKAVGDRESQLEGVRAELTAGRQALLDLEQAGFLLGADQSDGNQPTFEQYRTEYRRVSTRMGELQAHEQLLTFGGIEDGRVVGDDLLSGAIEGGKTVLGLGELQYRLTLAQDKLERYTHGVKAIQDQTQAVQKFGDGAQTQAEQYQKRMITKAEQVAALQAEIADLAQKTFDKEEAALQAARAAVSAYKTAKSAVDAWKRAAQSLQSAKDPQRTNDRLKRIIADNTAATFAENAEAGAKTLQGRVQTERALRLRDYLDTLQRLEALKPGGEFDLATLQDKFITARDEAVTVLNEARDGYERLAQKQSDTSWVHQASLAIVYHLLWQIDEIGAEQHRSNLLDQLGQVVESRWQSPYLRQQAALYAALTGRTGAPPPPEPPAETTPVEEEPPTEATP